MASNATEAVADPWVTCFLTSMVIRYLNGLEGIAGRMGSSEPSHQLLDP